MDHVFNAQLENGVLHVIINVVLIAKEILVMRKQVNATMDVILNGKEKNVINILLTVKTIKLM